MWDMDCAWVARPCVKICAYHPGPDRQLAKWIDLGLFAIKVQLPGHERFAKLNLEDSSNWMCFIETIGNRNYSRIVIIIDDYDQWSGTDRRNAYQVMETIEADYLESKIIFVLTGEMPLRDLREISEVAPTDSRIFACKLPTDETIINIVRQPIATSPIWLRNRFENAMVESIKDIKDVTGSNPALVQTLASGLATTANGISDWSSLFVEAQRGEEFQNRVRCLYEILSQTQQLTLSLIVIASEANLTLNEARKRLHVRTNGHIPSEEGLSRQLTYLKDNRLLIQSCESATDTANYIIRSLALREWIDKQALTTGLRVQMGISVKSGIGHVQLRFLWFLVFGIIWYLFAVVTQPFWLDRIPDDLVILVYFAGFIPAIAILIHLLKTIYPQT